jgi:hypothetical protein
MRDLYSFREQCIRRAVSKFLIEEVYNHFMPCVYCQQHLKVSTPVLYYRYFIRDMQMYAHC